MNRADVWCEKAVTANAVAARRQPSAEAAWMAVPVLPFLILQRTCRLAIEDFRSPRSAPLGATAPPGSTKFIPLDRSAQGQFGRNEAEAKLHPLHPCGLDPDPGTTETTCEAILRARQWEFGAHAANARLPTLSGATVQSFRLRGICRTYKMTSTSNGGYASLRYPLRRRIA